MSRDGVTRERIYSFIQQHIAQYGWAPTVSEIAAEVGLASKQSVHTHLKNLERDGLIVRGHYGSTSANARAICLGSRPRVFACEDPLTSYGEMVMAEQAS